MVFKEEKAFWQRTNFHEPARSCMWMYTTMRSFSQAKTSEKKNEARNENTISPFLTRSRFSSVFFSFNKDPVKSYLQYKTKHNSLKSASTQRTSNQTSTRFFPFIYSFWPWCRLDQTPGYRRVWEQGVNLRETAVCGGLGGDGEARRGKRMLLLTEKRELFGNKH